MASPHYLAHAIKQEIIQRADSIALQIGKGSCSNFEAYKHATGKVTGLLTALEIVDLVLEKETRKANKD